MLASRQIFLWHSDVEFSGTWPGMLAHMDVLSTFLTKLHNDFSCGGLNLHVQTVSIR